MNTSEIRQQIIHKIKEELSPINLGLNINFIQIEEFFNRQKTNIQKNASAANQKLAKKIYGTNYRCVCDEEEFQFCNNMKALMLAVFQIAFQDDYTASLIISEINQSSEMLAKIQNFPLQQKCAPQNYVQIIKHTILQLCDIGYQNLDIPIRNILSAYYLGLEMMALLFRSILIKLEYPSAQDYTNPQALKKTPQIFTIICQYLDINLIAKNANTKNTNSGGGDSSQVYLFTDYNIFICTPDNQQFISGIYFQNEDELKEAGEVNSSQIEILLGKSRRLDQSQIRRSYVRNSMKGSECWLDLGMSGSGFIFSVQPEAPFFNSNAPTPEFGIQGSESLKLRKSIQKEPELTNSYYPIKEESQHMEASQKRKEQSVNYSRLKTSSFIKDNITSIIINREDDQKHDDQRSQYNKEQKPQSPPTLAGIAEIRYIKKKTKTDESQNMKMEKQEINHSRKESEKGELPISVASPSISDFNSDQMLKYENMKLDNSDWPQFSQNYKQFPQLKPKFYKGSYNESSNLPKLDPPKKQKKQSDIISKQDKQIKSFETFSKKSRLHSVLEEIKKKNKDISDDSEISQQERKQNSQNSFTKNKFSVDSKIKSVRSYSQKSNLSRKMKNQIASNVVNIAFNMQPLSSKTKKSATSYSQSKDPKLRKFSENKSFKNFQSIGSRSQNLLISRNVAHDEKDGEVKLMHLKEKVEAIRQRQFPVYQKKGLEMRVSKGKSEKSNTKVDTARSNKKPETPKNKILAINTKQKCPRKFPQFLRNNKLIMKEKKLTESISNGKRNFLKQSIKMLKIQENPHSFQIPKIKTSPREENCQIKKNHHKKLSQIEQQNYLKKSKTTQSYPALLQQRFWHHQAHKNMTNSVMPEATDHGCEKGLDSSFTSLGKKSLQKRNPQNKGNNESKVNFCISCPTIGPLLSQTAKGVFIQNLSPKISYAPPLYSRNQFINDRSPVYRSSEQFPIMPTFFQAPHNPNHTNGHELLRRAPQMHYVPKEQPFGYRRY